MTETKSSAAKDATLPVPAKQTNVLLWLSYATIVGLWGASQFVLIPYVANCITLVAAILYVACHWSLALREEATDDDGTDGEDGSSAPPPGEILTAADAYQFPLVGSCSLFGLYMAFKYLDKDLVNMLIGGYFALAGCLALTATFGPTLLAMAGGKNAFLERTFRWKKSFAIPAALDFLLGPSPFEIDLEFQTVDIIAIIPSATLCYFYLMSKHWTLNNILGICFCIQGIRRFSLGTYKIGAILLVGLFFYGAYSACLPGILFTASFKATMLMLYLCPLCPLRCHYYIWNLETFFRYCKYRPVLNSKCVEVDCFVFSSILNLSGRDHETLMVQLQFWVFGTDVMVTVAKSLDGTIHPSICIPNQKMTTLYKISLV